MGTNEENTGNADGEECCYADDETEVSSFTGLSLYFFSSFKSIIPYCKCENKTSYQACFPNYKSQKTGKKKKVLK